MVFDGSTRSLPWPQRPVVQSLQESAFAKSPLRTRLQRPHRHDRGDGRRPSQEDHQQAKAHGRLRQQQGLPRPSILRDGQRLSLGERHRQRHRRLRERQREIHPQRRGERCLAVETRRPLLGEREIRRRPALLWRRHRHARQGARRLRRTVAPLQDS